MNSNGLVRGIGILGIGMAIATLLNFIFQLAMGNFLEESEFSTLIAFLGLMSIFNLPLGVFESETAVTISNKNSELPIDYNKNVAFFSPKNKHLASISVIALIACIAVIPVSGSIERISNGVLFTIIILILIMFRVRLGIFQGRKAYAEFSISNAINSFVKLTVGVSLLIFFDFGYRSGIIATMLGLTAGVLFLNSKKNKIDGKQINRDYLDLGKGSNRNIAIALLIIGLMLNWDVIVANQILNPEEAGQYSFSAVLAKVVILGSFAIIGVMVPSISELDSQEERFRILRKLLLAYVLFAGPVVALAYLFDGRIIELLFFRSNSEPIQGLLPIVVFCYSITSISQILVFSAIARSEVKEKIATLSLTSIIPIFSFLFVDSLQDLYLVMIGYSLLNFILLLANEFISLNGKIHRGNRYG